MTYCSTKKLSNKKLTLFKSEELFLEQICFVFILASYQADFNSLPTDLLFYFTIATVDNHVFCWFSVKRYEAMSAIISRYISDRLLSLEIFRNV